MKFKYKKTIKMILLALLLLVLAAFCYFFVGRAPKDKNIEWGVNFSQEQAQNLGLDWKATYLAILDDLGAKNLKVATYWDLIESKEGVYNFSDLDWEVQQAQERNAKLILVIGMKTPRWPECHIPSWAQGLSKSEQQQEILDLIGKIVSRYKDSPAVSVWQVENEPFFDFGECPWYNDKGFLKKEIAEVKSLDPTRPVMITDSGEFSFWFTAARYGDIVGVTMYKKVWFSELHIGITYPFPPVFYYRKAQLVKWLFGKSVIGVELQAEPWGSMPIYQIPLQEQLKTMNLKQFEENINLAENSGLSADYFWGAEWWYWMKTVQNDPSFWNEAKKIFNK